VKRLTVTLPDGRTFTVDVPDNGPHHFGLSFDVRRGDMHVYMDGRDGQWRWMPPKEETK